MSIFSIENTAVEVWGYAISYVELIGTMSGLISVYFASRANILTWPMGVVNVIFLFILFFQVQLYADMFLQVFFLVTTVYGWYNWGKGQVAKTISSVSQKGRMLIALMVVCGTILSGYLIAHIHQLLPTYFKIEAAYPYIDSFILVASVAATMLLAKKKVESWHYWIFVDIVAVLLYFEKGIYFLSFEYTIFLGLASYGWFNWKKQLQHD